MIEINGLDLQARIADRVDMPIIFITGHGDVPTSVRAMKGGAIDFLTKARAANPQIFYIHLDLAAAMALKGYLDDAHAALAEAIRLRPAINSIARQRARSAYTNNPAYRALAEKTVDVGLRLAGMPEE